ncbi:MULTISPECIES: gamma carbonic anhydrase family protein [Clostridiaceae]|uniref:Gamma carbonic anhydrase family protein n=1 Tax=Clostridium facile TaxID=2763035 RepID=A0ABR7ING4_9CLOT|nr:MULTISPECIES: gamma carbonic anhydrase family protein [Clostridiaceae]MBC5786675.1 gamma carbonic anhydrase family protein [Clostridium facile]
MKQPIIAKTAYLVPGVAVVGDVSIGEYSSIWYHAVIRGDLSQIKIGDRSNIQDGCILHSDAGMPLTIGNQVTVGHGAILHSCTIGDNSLIGMGAIVLNGAKIGKNCIVGAGALVTQNTIVPDNSLIFGNPAKVKRSLTPEEIQHNTANAEEYVGCIPNE